MRSRYVQKCKCRKIPHVETKRAVLRKGVLDINIEVFCSICGRLYREVGPKKVRMVDPEITKTVVFIKDEGGSFDADGGPAIEKSESTEITGMEEEQDVDEASERKESGDSIPDEVQETGPVEDKKTFKERVFGKKSGDIPERTTEEALKDSGVPEGELW